MSRVTRAGGAGAGGELPQPVPVAGRRADGVTGGRPGEPAAGSPAATVASVPIVTLHTSDLAASPAHRKPTELNVFRGRRRYTKHTRAG